MSAISWRSGRSGQCETERESAPLFTVDADGREYRRVENAASAELDPTGVGTRSTAFAPTDRASHSNSADGSVNGKYPDGVSTRCRARNRRA